MPHDLDTARASRKVRKPRQPGTGGRVAGKPNRPEYTNVKKLEAIKRDGRVRVAPHLYLQIEGGSRIWLFRRRKIVSLGRFDAMTLDDAKHTAAEMRRAEIAGADPRAKRIEPAAIERTVAQAFTDYIANNKAGWRSPITASNWITQPTAYVYPVIGTLAINRLTTAMVLTILGPIWAEKNVVADQVRNKLERVWNAEKALGRCSGQNPAQWTGHLATLLPARHKVHQEQSHASLPPDECPAFMARLRATTGLVARCLAFAILTGGRTDEARSAAWSEIDLQARTWRVRAGRMKGGKSQLVPLSDAAVAILTALPSREGFVFGNPNRFGKNAMLTLLGSFGLTITDDDGNERSVTVHGFRSSFNMWGEVIARIPRIILNMGLAHASDDKVLMAYLRNTGRSLDAERSACMQAWAAYLA
jgi:integrase